MLLLWTQFGSLLLLILLSGTVCFWEYCSTLMNFHALLWLIYWFCFYFYIMMTIIKASCMLCLHSFLFMNFSPSKKKTKKQEEKKRKYRIKNGFLKAWRAWLMSVRFSLRCTNLMQSCQPDRNASKQFWLFYFLGGFPMKIRGQKDWKNVNFIKNGVCYNNW